MNDPGAEIVAIVDADNRVTGQLPRSEMRRLGLIHRASYILVFNQSKELFVQKRTLIKDIYPGWYDVAAGGVVLSGESYEESARRELAEELGVEAELTPHFDHYYGAADNRVWGRVFSCQHDGPFDLQEEEVERGFFMAVEEVLTSTRPFTPDGLEILQRLRGRGMT